MTGGWTAGMATGLSVPAFALTLSFFKPLTAVDSSAAEVVAIVVFSFFDFFLAFSASLSAASSTTRAAVPLVASSSRKSAARLRGLCLGFAVVSAGSMTDGAGALIGFGALS